VNPVSGQAPRHAAIFGIRFSVLTVCELIDFVSESAAGSGRAIIDYVNVRSLNLAYADPWLKDFLNRCDLLFCDGIGVVIGANILGYRMGKKHRMTCPDFLDTLASRLAAESRSLYLLAGAPGVAAKAAELLAQKHPGLKVAHHHGYFKKTGPESEAVLAELERFRPDVLYVGFGMPVQERWIAENLDRLPAKVILPLGACLDFYTGMAYRGPRWMTDHGLEWLGRLFTESPKRVWGRYVIGNPLFLLRVLMEKLRGRGAAGA
jgi:N-acetylglucosaminyldiphosphoundecaprenol N-acetyl-beta-D-mannosaminyltransferase